MTRKLAVLEAPSLTLPRAAVPCAQQMRYALRQRDLVARLGARDACLVEPPTCAPEWESGCRSGKGILALIEALAVQTRQLVAEREFPIVLGGDCSTLLGNMFALRSLGRYGLVFVDGHDDFSYSHVRDRQKHCGYFAAAGLDLAVATGNGPDALSNLRGLKPYVEERHVVLFGMVSDEELATEALAAGPVQQYRLERIRAIGAGAAAEQAVQYLEAQSLDGFWIHLDADVLDRSTPVGDGPEASGLEFEELTDALRVFLASDRVTGLELTIDDPELDPDGVCGDRLVDSIVRAFRPDA